MPNQWVVLHEGKWAVRAEGSDSVTSIHDTQGEAIEAGRRIAMNQRVELIIQGENGRIRERNSYGNDPRGGG
jgi:hypothetical protein